MPHPQELEIFGVSGLDHDDVRHYFPLENPALPARGDLLSKIEQADQESDAQLVCGIDGSLDNRAEGYVLDIDGDQIRIVGKDKAGLPYLLACSLPACLEGHNFYCWYGLGILKWRAQPFPQPHFKILVFFMNKQHAGQFFHSRKFIGNIEDKPWPSIGCSVVDMDPGAGDF